MNNKRVLGLFFTIILLFVGISLRLYYLAASPYGLQIREAALRQQQMIIPMAKRRGIIYDCRLRPLNYPKVQGIALVEPMKASDKKQLQNSLFYASLSSYDEIEAAISLGEPFSISLSSAELSENGVKSVESYAREGNVLAPHVLGYVKNDESMGLAGIEKGYNNYLTETGGQIYAVGQKIASGQLLKFGDIKIVDDNYYNSGGVALTLDRDMQKIAETAAEAIDKGAVVLIENATNKIRAMASRPTFDSGNIANYLTSKDGEFVNRALEPYNVGSIFKIIVSAVAIESDFKTKNYTCTGGIVVNGQKMACHKLTGHGTVNFETAFEQSCNTYFINLCAQLDFSKIIDMAEKLGFTNKYIIALELTKKAGALPKPSDGKNARVVANSAIGQGDIMASPIDLAMLVACVANGGTFLTPSVVEGLVNDEGKIVPSLLTSEAAVRAMSVETADKIAEMMVNTCLRGTGKGAQPEGFGAGGKTASAETGWVIDGEKVVHGIFAGFFPADTKKYSLVVLVENGRTGGGAAGPVFKEIAERVMEIER